MKYLISSVAILVLILSIIFLRQKTLVIPEIGMTKADFLFSFSSAKKIEKAASFGGGSLGEENLDTGNDCYLFSQNHFFIARKFSTVCFREDKIFVIIGENDGFFGSYKVDFIFHPDREKTLANLNIDTCNQVEKLPYFVGYLSKDECLKMMMRKTGDPEICKAIGGGQKYDFDCISYIVDKEVKPSLCDLLVDEKDYNACYSSVAFLSADAAFCNKLKPIKNTDYEVELKSCVDNSKFSESRKSYTFYQKYHK